MRDPGRTIPRAIPLALAITLAIYAVVAVAALAVLGPHRLAQADAPLSEAVKVAGVSWLAPVVRVGAAVAAVGSLLALLLGVSRTTLAMARDRHLPHVLAAVHPRFNVPYRAELMVGAVVAALSATLDVRAAIGFSSFAVLVYYAIANASALTLAAQEGRPAGRSPSSGSSAAWFWRWRCQSRRLSPVLRCLVSASPSTQSAAALPPGKRSPPISQDLNIDAAIDTTQFARSSTKKALVTSEFSSIVHIAWVESGTPAMHGRWHVGVG